MGKQVELSKRDAQGKFLPGESGNPAGRPEGIRNQITIRKLLLENTITEELEGAIVDMIHVAIRMAKDGDKQMLKLLVGDIMSAVRNSTDKGPSDSKIHITITNMTGNKDQEPTEVSGVTINGDTPDD